MNQSNLRAHIYKHKINKFKSNFSVFLMIMMIFVFQNLENENAITYICSIN